MCKKNVVLAAISAGLAAGTSRLDAAQSWRGPDGGSWSDPANWLGTPPDNGDVPWFIRDGDDIDVLLDLPNVTLDGVFFDSPGRFAIVIGAPANSITLTGSGTIHVERSGSGSPQFVALGHYIGVQLLGSAGLNKIGPGEVRIGSVNSYSGGTTISGGTLTTSVGDGAFGNAAGSITLNGGALRSLSSFMSSARDLLVLGPATIDTEGSAVFSGTMSGAGELNKTGRFGSLAFTGPVTHTEAINIHGGTFILSGAAAATGTPGILAGGTIVLDNAASNDSNRIGDATPITFLGSALTIAGNSGGNTQETVGAATLASGLTFVTLQPTASSGVQLTLASISRPDRATAFFRGNSLGQTTGSNVGNVFLTSPPTLIGGGGAAGSTNISIIPWAYGGVFNTIASTDATNGFVTYVASGIRPLSNSEYVTSIGAGVSTDNVRVGTNSIHNTAATINSLKIAHPSNNPITILGTGTIGITSGAILNLGGLASITPAVDFGSAEGVIHAAVRLSMGGKISGSNGLTKSAPGSLRLSSAASNYTGPTIVLGGDLSYTGSVIGGTPGPLGSDSSAIVLAPGGSTNPTGAGIARLWADGPGTSTFARDLIVRGNPGGVGGFGTSGAFFGQIVVMDGDIDVQTHLQFQGDPESLLFINGDISGPGMLSDGFGSIQQINGNNTYSGGTDILGGHWIVGASGALGTGTIWFDNAAAQLSSSVDDIELFNPVIVKQGFTISGDRTLSLGGSMDLGGASFGQYITNTATTTYAGQLFNGGLTKFGAGALRLESNNRHSGGTIVNDGTLIAARTTALGAGSVLVNGGTLRLEEDYPIAYVIRGLSVAAPGNVDITNSHAIVDYDGSTPLPDIMQMLNDGRLISSAAVPGQTTVGVAEGAVLYPSGGSFHSVPVNSTTILLSHTFAGDSDLDGDVDVADLGRLATAWQAAAPWTDGDFDHDGTVNVNDLGLLATNWQAGVDAAVSPASLGDALQSLGLPSASVPEPLTPSTMLMLTVFAASRRVNRRRHARPIDR
jgi:autotransporter-associated beta strand protein